MQPPVEHLAHHRQMSHWVTQYQAPLMKLNPIFVGYWQCRYQMMTRRQAQQNPQLVLFVSRTPCLFLSS